MHILEEIYFVPSYLLLVLLFCRWNKLQRIQISLTFLWCCARGFFSRSQHYSSQSGTFLQLWHSERTWPGQHSLITASLISRSHSLHLLPPTSVVRWWNTLFPYSLQVQTHDRAPQAKLPRHMHWHMLSTSTVSILQTVHQLQWYITHRA